MNNFILKINYRLILIHLLASVFILLGAERFALLYDFELFEISSKEEVVKYIENGQISATRLSYYLLVHKSGGLIGLLISFLISLMICIKKKIFWLNAITIFITAFFLYRFDILDSMHITMPINSFVDLFAGDNLMVYVIASGLILISIGLFLFFNKWTICFIEKSSRRTLE
ncbi:hypothetical protein [Cytophaga aurantiaca]|uniref:hypothetical protein n=1 Tax=Cytophaga aurantiaca TaxID=29530 RepID=UPI00036EC247|nr:hypothetical protein [Cytophaga aurantiaca]